MTLFDLRRPRSLSFLAALVSALAFAGVAGCSGDTGSDSHVDPDPTETAIRAQMNDVSILFPLPTSKADLGNLLGGKSHGARGDLLPASLYDAAGGISGTTFSGMPVPGAIGHAEYPDLHVVGMRIDPCFADLSPDPHGHGCTAQIRLVFQEVTAPDGAATAFDSGLHALYELDREEFLLLARALVELREESGGRGVDLGPLGPHPLMKKQGLGGIMAKGVRDLILKFAGTDNLVRITEMSGNGETFTWFFTGFDVEDGAIVHGHATAIPSLPKKADQQVFSANFTQDLEGEFEPSTRSKFDMTALANQPGAKKLDRGERDAAFAALLAVEDPSKTSPENLDCASCHLATPAARLVAGPLFSMSESKDPRAFTPKGGHVKPADMAATFDEKAPLNFHAFSYVDRKPGINQRTVNESAAIVEYLNALGD